LSVTCTADQDTDFFNNITIVSATRNCSERTTIRERRGSHCINDKSTDEMCQKLVSRNASKSFTSFSKIVSLSKGTAIRMMELLCK
jgi:hypothetical protein